MRMLWTIFKVALAAAIIIPLTMIALSMALGILGALTALAFLVLRVALIGLVGYALFRGLIAIFGGGSKSAKQVELKPLMPPRPPIDPHYDAAMRELDRELKT
jgi:hypothetical protein